MELFDKTYYDDIWGTIHRHDYCENLANTLIEKHGHGRMLDIGTGCGYLVKVLREKGVEAWGLEISDYAIENTCAKGYVLKGSVLDIPFKSNYFNVVHSQGLWEYVKEDEVPGAIAECHRVGFNQEHSIDTAESPQYPEGRFITVKPDAWWKEQLKGEKVLLACANHECKEYAFQEWIDSVKVIDHPNLELLVVDNSPTTDFMNRWKDQIPIIHIDLGDKGPNQRIGLTMEYIRKYFLDSQAAYWFNVESDIILPPHSLKYMLGLGRYDWNEHHYPYRDNDNPALLNGFGCTIFSRRLLAENSFAECPEDNSTDGWYWNKIVTQNPNFKNYKVIESYNVLDIAHLGNGVTWA